MAGRALSRKEDYFQRERLLYTRRDTYPRKLLAEYLIPMGYPRGLHFPFAKAEGKKGVAILWPRQLHDSFLELTHDPDARAKRSNH